MEKKVVIVGGVAGGASAAARLRRLNEDVEIVMFERGQYISFANCGLPYYIGEAIQERDQLLVQTVEGMESRYRMDIRPLSEVTRIDRERKTVTVEDRQRQKTYEETYDVLLLSPGAQPLRPPIPGIDEAEHLFTLRTIPDTDRIKGYIDQQHPRQAVVVGGGFIGLEMAENLAERGLQVTLVEAADQVMAPLDEEMAAIIQEHLREKGIQLILGDGVKAFEERGRKVRLNSGKAVENDLVLLAIGVRPESRLAADAGLETGKRGGIIVDEFLRTSDPAIYAVGDAVEVRDYIRRQPVMIPLAWPANRQGRIAADNILGAKKPYRGTLGTAIAKVFDLTAAATGNNEKALRGAGIRYESVHIHPASHAGYYPGASPIALKLIFDGTTGKIFGAQAVGKEGVDKRIDVIATAIKGGMSVQDLQDLELAYAPPYSSAKDPVNMAGYAAANMMEGLVQTIQWHEVEDAVAQGRRVIDVRDPDEFADGSIPTAVNIPLNQLRERLDEIGDQEVILYCQVGLRGYLAARILMQRGFTARNLDGGYLTYQCAKEECRSASDPERVKS